MKKLLLLVLSVGLLKAYGQNEFAATAFYTSFKIIFADAKIGFEANRGEPLYNKTPGKAAEYKVKFMLPLAESGKIVKPVSGNPYAVYFFEPEKKKEKIDKRAVNLREAILTAIGSTLYAKTVSVKTNNHILSDTYLFSSPDVLNDSNALFRISIFFQDNKYHMFLEISGNKVDMKNAAGGSIFHILFSNEVFMILA